MTTTEIILLAAPPLAGAVIGFITNVIAIKMLFRPLREIRVFGIRVPFTPGILPRQRHKLADSIGAMVERELLTPELLRERLASGDVEEKLTRALSGFTGKILERPLNDLFADNAGSELGSLVRDLGQSCINSPASAAVSDLIRERVRAELVEQFPAVSASLIGFLRQPEIHREMEIHGRIFLSGVILKLNVFQRFFISAGQYDRTLNEQMPGIIDGLIDQLDDLLGTDNIRARALELADSILSRYFTAGKSLDAIMRRAGNSLLENHGEKNLQTLLAISGAQKDRLDNFLSREILRIADNSIENLLRTINVRTMVARRIDALDMIRVERIILDVMANQLKWIDLFGALLGFLIGTFQSLINFYLR